VIERGGSIAERTRAVEEFVRTGQLDTETNIQFGAGGAGTFSDGKLVTRISDARCSYVLERFVEFGAPEEILWLAKPHVGTDRLLSVVDGIAGRIEALGGEIRYHTKLDDLALENGRVTAVTLTDGDMRETIPADAVILAVGHSARDTYSGILQKGMAVEAKPISVGMRIEHLADDIDKALYGDNAGNALLGRAEYNLSHNTHERGVYTFCMCPGGEVVAAASEEGGVVVNGMSRHSRAGVNSNSAVVCSIFPTDYGNTPERAIAFQREIESRAFKAGGGDYTAPAVTVGDFLCDKAITEPYRVIPSYMESGKIKIASPREYLPDFTVNAIKAALVGFDRSINGFASESAVLTGAETRTSAPLRILRDPETRLARGYSSVYPAGEGAGYAGGITSAAIDGIKTAIAIIEKYKPNI
jgi:uncharacterized FAD-dependent dehydrogenase